MDVRDKIYINGSWVPSSGTGTLEVIDSTTEEVMATIPEGTLRTWTGPSGRRRPPSRPGRPPLTRREPRPWCRIGEALAARTDEIARSSRTKWACPSLWQAEFRSGFRRARSRRRTGGLVVPLGRGDRNSLVRTRAGRRSRRHHPVELPPLQIALKVPGPRAGLPPSSSSQARSPAERVRAGRGHSRGRPARGRVQPRHRRRPVVGEAIVSHPLVDMVSFYRLDPRRQADHGAGLPNVKRVALELGGKSANILLDDADFERRYQPTLRLLPELGSDLFRPHPHARAP